MFSGLPLSNCRHSEFIYCKRNGEAGTFEMQVYNGWCTRVLKNYEKDCKIIEGKSMEKGVRASRGCYWSW